jgi:hypothetical protein
MDPALLERIAVSFSASQEHSCSQSWQSQSWSGQLWLELRPTVRLGLQGKSYTLSGLQPEGGSTEPPSRHEEALSCEWKGTALPDGAWQMKQSSGMASCGGDFVMRCEPGGKRLRCVLSGAVPPLLDLLGGPGGESPGLVLGPGLQLEAEDYGMGTVVRRVSER